MHFGKKCILAFPHTPPIDEHPGAVVVRDIHRANVGWQKIIERVKKKCIFQGSIKCKKLERA